MPGVACAAEVSRLHTHASETRQEPIRLLPPHQQNRSPLRNPPPPPTGHLGKHRLFRQRGHQPLPPTLSAAPHNTSHSSSAAGADRSCQLCKAACTRRVPPAAAVKARPVRTQNNPCDVHPHKPEPRREQPWRQQREPRSPPRESQAPPLQHPNRVPARTPPFLCSTPSQRSGRHRETCHTLTPTAPNESEASGGADSDPGWDPSLWELWA